MLLPVARPDKWLDLPTGVTWEESNDPDKAAKLARIEQTPTEFPDRTFAFDEFGPLTIRPHGGATWAPTGHPDRLPANAPASAPNANGDGAPHPPGGLIAASSPLPRHHKSHPH